MTTKVVPSIIYSATIFDVSYIHRDLANQPPFATKLGSEQK